MQAQTISTEPAHQSEGDTMIFQDLNTETVEDRFVRGGHLSVSELSAGARRGDCSPRPFTSGNVKVYFDNLERELCGHIAAADFVVGCTAWLTSTAVLTSLSKPRHGCQIVVQKEDFLRPDAGDSGYSWARSRRKLYDGLVCRYDRQFLPGVADLLDYCHDGTTAAVRCAGNHNRDRKPTHPRMHHKFLVFCHAAEKHSRETDGFLDEMAIPYAVWTGSFNPTHNGSRSRENAVYIADAAVANRYAYEWAAVFAISETLDWTDPWCSPEWHVGS